MLLAVGGDDGLGEVATEGVRGQGHDGAAEAAPCQAGTDNAGSALLLEKPDEGIQFRSAVFKEVPRTRVGGKEKVPDGGQVPGFEGIHTGGNASVFLNNVFRPAPDIRMAIKGTKGLPVRFDKKFEPGIRLPEQLEGLAAFSVTAGIEGINEAVLAVGVENPEVQARWKRDGLERGPGTIDTDEMVPFPETGDSLVKDATWYADKGVFGPLGQKHLTGPGQLKALKGGDSLHCCQFYGRTAAETGPGGKVTCERQVKTTAEGVSGLGKDGHHPEGVIDP